MYGTAAGVAAYCTVYTTNGSFSTTTRPTQAIVEGWIAQISSMLDLALSGQGFRTPLTDTEAVSAATAIVEQLTSDLVKASHNTGRFFSENSMKSGVSFWRVITNDLNNWVEEYAGGLEDAGASRGDSNQADIAFRAEDESGNPIAPIMQRSGFGNVFENWDNG